MQEKYQDRRFLQHAGVQFPIIGGPMYPCSNPELVAAISNAGGLGVIQPLSLTYVYGYEFEAGLAYLQNLTSKPLAMNALIEKSSKRYLRTMQAWVDIALQHGIRFFITSLGKPDWVVNAVHSAGGVVYHDATETKWAQKGVDSGVDGLIAVNNRAGGHAGNRNAEQLYGELRGFGLPLVCAGGIACRASYLDALRLGYSAVQSGTVFIATPECRASERYKQAIVDAREEDIILTQKLTGVSISIIKPVLKPNKATNFGPLLRILLKSKWSKHWMRFLLFLSSMRRLKKMITHQADQSELWQAGKSVADISAVRPVADIIAEFVKPEPAELGKDTR